MPNTLTRREEEAFSPWEHLPDDLVFQVFSNLPVYPLLNASQVCKQWYRVAQDEFLWRHLFQMDWKVDTSIPMSPRGESWKSEYMRLFYHTPRIESEVLKDHKDQVLHVSYSHDGKLFATTSKDGYIKVWNSGYPASVKYYADMKEFTWKYTQSSQFNQTDTLLLVSGVHFGSHSTSGEIAVFRLRTNPDGFELQSRVLNKPYDIFGTWYNETCLLSGNLHWLGHLTSCSVLWLNKASQALHSEYEPVVLRLYKFRNVNASSIRTIMIARCHDDPNKVPEPPGKVEGKKSRRGGRSKVKTTECSQGKVTKAANAPTQKMQIYCDEHRFQLLEVDDSSLDGTALNGTIEYNASYRQAETGRASSESGSENLASCSNYASSASCGELREVEDTVDSSSGVTEPTSHSSQAQMDTANPSHISHSPSLSPKPCTSTTSAQSSYKPLARPRGSFTLDLSKGTAMECDGGEDSDSLTSMTTEGSSEEGMMSSSHSYEDYLNTEVEAYVQKSADTAPDTNPFFPPRTTSPPPPPKKEEDKYLIFTTGRKTYTPHQIGIKRISHEDTSTLTSHLPMPPPTSKPTPVDGTATEPPDQAQPMAEGGEGSGDPAQPIGEGGVQGAEGVAVPPAVAPNVPGEPEVDNSNDIDFDSVDHLIELHGHIIGMCLSPDQRYLYVNSRPWPQGYEIEEPLYPPPIAQEIDIHVIDLQTMQEVGTMHRAHKAYTPNDECFFIFLDVCDQYVASGAEDRHGYLWDRHYGVCLTKYPHNDVVNCVAFNSADPETLVTVSDDNTIKIWRSRHKVKQLHKDKGKVT